ncbi:MAG: protein translocase subunit SecF [Clostridiales bacterium]|jgi:preprotein translocase SecF subunit|nr:protein translocase subunit SecF [Clostridiales bacterium]
MSIVEHRIRWITVSLALIAIGVAFLAFNVISGKGAFSYDVEFTGGTDMSINIGKPFENNDINAVIVDTLGIEGSQIQKVLGSNQVAIKMKSIDSEQRAKLTAAFKEKYALNDDVFSIDDISGSISREMQVTAIQAVLAACAGILIYVTIRFRDWRMGLSAILALTHDSILVILSYAVFRIPLNYSFIAAILTILGFSINATIIVFDRLRENRKLMRRPPLDALVNASVTQTIKRCVYTSVTVLIATVSLYVVGVASVKDFMLPIAIGIIVGTYSSVFVSGSLYFMMSSNNKKPKAA